MFSHQTFLLLESMLKVDQSFLRIIKDIASSSYVANHILGLISRDIKTNLNYLKPGKANDEALFLNDTQVQRVLDQGMDPFTRANNSSKIGRIARQLLTSNGVAVTDVQIADFVNKYKNSWDNIYDTSIKDRIRLVSGEDIRYWYLYTRYYDAGGTLNNSCMKGDKAQDFFNIYVENPESCSMLIYTNEDNKLMGRSLVWKTDSGRIYQDRIYTVQDSDSYMLNDWIKNKYPKALTYMNGDYQHEIKIPLAKWKFEKYPYMDSLYYINVAESCVQSTEPSRKSLYLYCRNTDGLHQTPGWIWSDYQKEHIKSDDAVRVLDVGVVSRSICVECRYVGGWILRDNSVRSELYGNLPKNISTETEWGWAPTDELRKCFITKDEFKNIPAMIISKDKNIVIVSSYESRSQLYAKIELTYKTIEGGTFFLHEKSLWMSRLASSRRQIELLSSPFDDETMIKTAPITMNVDTRFSMVCVKEKKSGMPVGIYLSDSSNRSAPLVLSTEEEVKKYGLSVSGDSRFYVIAKDYIKALIYTDTMSDEMISGYGQYYAADIKAVHDGLLLHSSAYQNVFNRKKYAPTYDFNNTIEKINKRILANPSFSQGINSITESLLVGTHSSKMSKDAMNIYDSYREQVPGKPTFEVFWRDHLDYLIDVIYLWGVLNGDMNPGRIAWNVLDGVYSSPADRENVSYLIVDTFYGTSNHNDLYRRLGNLIYRSFCSSSSREETYHAEMARGEILGMTWESDRSYRNWSVLTDKAKIAISLLMAGVEDQIKSPPTPPPPKPKLSMWDYDRYGRYDSYGKIMSKFKDYQPDKYMTPDQRAYYNKLMDEVSRRSQTSFFNDDL